MIRKSYIWSFPTRVLHWLLVFYVAVAFLTSEIERFLDIHASFGYGIALLVLFRIGWFFIGPKYSKFQDFNIDIKKAVKFAINIFNPKENYAGHNPAASIVMLGIIAILFFTVLSGVLTYGVQEAKGLLYFLNSSMFKEMELFEEIHEFLGKLLILAIFAHLGGVFLDRVLHKEDRVLESMIDGYKNIEAKSIKLNLFQKIYAFIMLFLAVVIPLIAIGSDTVLTKSAYKKIDYQKEFFVYVEECASCHTLYPPFLLPKNSWKKMMNDLENHFGDDASLDSKTKEEIERFLVKNSSESSTKEAAFYISKSIKDDIMSVTKTPFLKKKHKDIDKKVFESKKVRTKSNCKACHTDFENGLIEDDLIKEI